VIRLFSTCTLRLLLLCLLAAPAVALAQGDEIQVYDGSLAPVGVFNLTVHNNFTPIGVKDPSFPGALVSDKSFNGVPEWALGVTNWFEAGLYMPLYSIGKVDGSTEAKIDGFKLRALFAVPRAEDRRFFYGANFEFSVNAEHWDESRVTSEVRPIVGWHLKPVDLIVNPILDTSYDGFGNMVFAPSIRVAYNVNDAWAVSAEEYAEYGPLHDFSPAGEQSHQLFGVIDHTTKSGFEIEAGVGVGLTDASDRLTLKLILARDLTKPKGARPVK
jgi:hypothetical protein